LLLAELNVNKGLWVNKGPVAGRPGIPQQQFRPRIDMMDFLAGSNMLGLNNMANQHQYVQDRIHLVQGPVHQANFFAGAEDEEAVVEDQPGPEAR
jgi:hypothetical protein